MSDKAYPFKVDDPVFVWINGKKDRVTKVQRVTESINQIIVDGSTYEVNLEMGEAYLTSSEGYSRFTPARRKPRKNYFKVTKASEADIKDFYKTQEDVKERRNLWYDYT